MGTRNEQRAEQFWDGTQWVRLVPWNKFRLSPHPGDREYNPNAALDKLPDEVLHKIFDEAADVDWGAALADRDPMAFPDRIAAILPKLRLSPLLASRALAFWLDRLLLFEKLQQDGKQLYYWDPGPAGTERSERKCYASIISSITLRMSIDSTKTLTAIANNPHLAPLIKTVKFHAYDYPDKHSTRDAFKDLLVKRWFPVGPEGSYCRNARNKMTQEQFERCKEFEYLAYRRLLTEHQQILRDGTFDKAMANVNAITFTRELEWGTLTSDLSLLKPTPSTIVNRDIKDADLKLLKHDPIYWRGFLKLAAAASIYSKIDTLAMTNMAIAFFRNINNLGVHCTRDHRGYQTNLGGMPRDGTPRCRNGFKKGRLTEAMAWSKFLTAPKHLESFALSVDQYRPRSTAPACALVDLVLKMAAPNSFVKLYLGGVSIDLDTFRTLMRDHSFKMTHTCLDGIRLFSEAYSTYEEDVDRYPVAPEESVLAEKFLDRMHRMPLKVAVVCIGGDHGEFTQMFEGRFDFREMKTMEFGTKRIEIVKEI